MVPEDLLQDTAQSVAHDRATDAPADGGAETRTWRVRVEDDEGEVARVRARAEPVGAVELAALPEASFARMREAKAGLARVRE